ncbi:SDR family oxidoreductase [Nocardia sp. NPDC051833]|uniref:SDR family oxidoreductase n=1 Tax=Nocardia sp. NPDC051833 TaxID=3155674 RepID=UPI0034210028
MNIAGKVAVVTGGGAGIGAATAAALAAAGARVVVSDLHEATALATSERINLAHPGATVGIGADATDRAAIEGLVALAESCFGPVDLYFANAGILEASGLGDDAEWDRALEVNLRAHVRAAQVLVPGWLERGAGYFVSTASAAGLLTQIGSATYSVSKHAAVGFAEWLSVTYGDRGIRVSCVCPMGVNTTLLHGREAEPQVATATRAVTTAGTVLEPEQVATAVLAAIATEQFLVLPHPDVLEMYRRKGSDYDRWLRGMRRFQSSLLATEGQR